MCRIAYTFTFFAVVCFGRRTKFALQSQFDENRPVSQEANGQDAFSVIHHQQRGLRTGADDQADGLGAFLLALAPGLGVRHRMRNTGVGQNHVRHPTPGISMNPSDEKSERNSHPRMQATQGAVIDTLTRRGEDEGIVVNNEWFSADENEKLLDKYRKRVERIDALEDEIEELEDEELAAKTVEFRQRLQNGETEDDILEEAFAVVREAAWRTLELRHYDVQLIGAMGLHDGMITQMGTGEGKTLVSTCAVYLNALRQGGNFLITVNDYLARRDCEQMGQVYRFLGMSVGLIQQGMTPPQRQEAYRSDVTYVTNSELGFDYLRDHCEAMQESQIVLPPKFNFCVVDEGDAVLIDDARTPLIISGPSQTPGEEKAEKYKQATKVAEALEKDRGYTVDMKKETVSIQEEGVDFIENALQVDMSKQSDMYWFDYIQTALKAKEFKLKDRDYLVKDGTVELVDIFTGRVLEGRRFGGGLHQALEAKEGVEIRPETEQVAAITYPALFEMFDKLSAMSGTVITEAEEFSDFYGLKVLDVPPALPRQRVDVPNSVFQTKAAKTKAVFDELVAMHKSGRPILLGTTSVEISELCSGRLDELGIKHEVLNAKPDVLEREAEIVAQAGRKGAVTIATNMAGRGTDILLGGSPKFMAQLRVRDSLAAAAGITVPKVSDDFYPCDLSSESLKLLEDAAAKYVKDEEPKETNDLRKLDLDELLAVAASSGPVYEGSAEDLTREAYDAIKEQYSETLAAEKVEVATLGGLHVIGTNLHDSRRVDDQLKGRAGRQGDPGSSHFFLSLEDQIFKTFNADKIAGVLEFLRVPEDTPLESEAVTNAVKQTQAKVEEYFYSIRKGSQEMEQIQKNQRLSWYELRDEVLRNDASQMLQWLKDAAPRVVETIVQRAYSSKISLDSMRGRNSEDKLSDEDILKKIVSDVQRVFPDIDLSESVLAGKSREEMTALAKQEAVAEIDKKIEYLNGINGELAFSSAKYLALIQADNLWQRHMKNLVTLKESAFVINIAKTRNTVGKNLRSSGAGSKQEQDYGVSAGIAFRDLEVDWWASTIVSLLKYQPKSKAA